MNKQTASLADGRTVEFVPTPIGEGGMKTVFFTTDRKSVLCFFKDQAKAAEPSNLARLEALLGKWNPTADATHGKYFADLFCWPSGIVVRPGLGIMTPAYSSNFFFATGQWKGKEKEGKWFSSPKLRTRLPPEERGNWVNYLQLCILMARGVRKMHLSGLAHSDLSCRNVLIDPPGGRCAIIDVDSLVVPGLHPPDVLGTPGYIAPEVIATQHLRFDDLKRSLPCNLTDLHAMAVLFYEYLLRRHPLRGKKVNGKPDKNGLVDPGEDERLSMGEKALFIEHPQDKTNPPLDPIKIPCEAMGPYLYKLFLKAFIDGLHNPPVRPAAAAWEDGLCKTADLLIPCGNSACEEKWFVYLQGRKPVCPWCGWKLTSKIPLLEFHYAPRPGQFRPEGHCLVAWHQRPLNKWHILTGVKPVEGVDRETQAYVLFHQNQWILVNKHLDSMISPSGNPVPKGQACLLREGDDIQLSKDDKGRLVNVKFIP